MVLLRFCSAYLSKRFAHKYTCKMNKAYLRYLADESVEKFEISFNFVQPELKINRNFNFCRSSSETVSSFLSRISTNVEKRIKKKNKKAVEENETNVTVSLHSHDKEVEGDVLCKDVFVPEKNVRLKILDVEFEVLVNSPWVSGLGLPTAMMAGFHVYPNKFESVYTSVDLSEFSWFKSKDKKMWELLSSGFLYKPDNSEIDSYLKLVCVPKNRSSEGPSVEAVSDVPVSAGPGPCPFEQRHKFTTEKCKGDSFRIVSYNILADLYCDSDHTREVLYPYCPPYALNMDYRKQLIVKELLGYNADIICLQEVDRRIFKNDLKILFEHIGYDCELSLKGAEVAEGVACIHNKKKFERLQTYRFVPSEEINKNPLFSDMWKLIETNEKLVERILTRSTVLQVNVLKSLEKNEILIVANTHLYFHPDADHIRLLQAAIFMKYLENLIGTISADDDKRVSLVFSGDFNTVPECGIYELFTTGAVAEDHVDFRSNTEESVTGFKLKQPFQLSSACGTPQYTNFTAGFAACLDYIFYEQKNLEVTQVVPLPAVEELSQSTALPSVVFPSDHISLVSDLRWKS